MIEIPTIRVQVNHVWPTEPEWAKTISEYLDTIKLPKVKEAAKKIKRSATQFVRVDGILYKKGFAPPIVKVYLT